MEYQKESIILKIVTGVNLGGKGIQVHPVLPEMCALYSPLNQELFTLLAVTQLVHNFVDVSYKMSSCINQGMDLPSVQRSD